MLRHFYGNTATAHKKEVNGMDRQKVLREWIELNFKPALRTNQYITDFMMRRLFENSVGGFTVAQDEYIEAMIAAGFIGRPTRRGEWVFNLRDTDYRKSLKQL